MRTKRTLVVLSMIFGAGLVLSACDEAEQGRNLSYQKGSYLGQKDQVLTERQNADLRARTRMQEGN